MKALSSCFLLLLLSTFAYSQVDLSLTKSIVTPAPYQYGQDLAYTIVITNNGNLPVTNIQLQENIPCGLVFNSSSVTWTPSGSNLFTTLSTTINPGQSTTVFLDFDLQACIEDNAWLNTVQIISFTDANGNNLTDPNIANNIDTAEPEIYDLALRKRVAPGQTPAYGTPILFHIEVFNQGNRPVRNIGVRDYALGTAGFTFNSAINPGWTGAIPTMNFTSSATVNPGDSLLIPITLTMVNAVGGIRSWLNYAEIRTAQTMGGSAIFDADSAPASNTIAENNVLPGSPNDDNLLTGGPLVGEDQDDHDPAQVQVFDLALTKTQQTALLSFSYIQNVSYVFTIYNQGNTPATNIQVADYLPVGLQYNPTALNALRGWSYNSVTRVATINYTDVLQPGILDTFVLDLMPQQNYVNNNEAWTDFGEIISADDLDPLTPSPMVDIDSSPDNIQNNDAGGLADSPSDNAINGNGTGTYLDAVAATDEDDHDPHKIQINDLALRMTVQNPQSAYIPGQYVTFALTIYNQGNVPLKNINVIDSIPNGYLYIPGGVNAGWTGSGPKISRLIPPILFPMEDTTIFLTLQIKPLTDSTDLINRAEISAVQDTLNNNRNDDADSVLDTWIFNDNQPIPGSSDDNNIFGDSNLDQDEDDADIEEVSVTCEKPTLTVGLIACDPSNNSYRVGYYSNVSTITASLGNLGANWVTGIPLGQSTTITASGAPGCTVSLTVPPIATCPVPSSCVQPKLTVGQPLCAGNTYSVSFSNDLGTVTTTAGIISGRSIINIPIGSNITVTATNGACLAVVQVTAPLDCNIPCANSPISISGPICDPTLNGTYTVNFTAAVGTSVQASSGILSGSSITQIPSGVPVTLTITTQGCITRIVTVPPADCPLCIKPTVTIGQAICDANNMTYSVLYYSSTTNITSSIGNVSSNRISSIPLGTDVMITATVSPGCSETLMNMSPNVCNDPSGCIPPQLTLGQPICNGNTYSVSFSHDIGTISVSAGNISGNSVINIPIGTNITVTATSGLCVSRDRAISPLSCTTLCQQSPISISGPSCTPGNTYSIRFITIPGINVTSNIGTLSAGEVRDIPTGQAVTLTITQAGCPTRVVTIPSATCTPQNKVIAYAWHDQNANGQQGSSEPPLSGTLVKLFNSSNVLIGQTTTNSLGLATFLNVPAGNYYLNFVPNSIFTPTFSNVGSDETDSDIDNVRSQGSTALFTVVDGSDVTNVDGGFYDCVEIGDLVWYDTDKDDIWDPSENGINGIRVNLWYKLFGTWIIWDYTYTGNKPGTTSEDGYFKFCAPPGEYYVQFVMPPLGLVQALPNKGNDEERDSDVTDANGIGTTNTFSQASGTMRCDIGAGYYPMATLGNLVWLDADADGLQGNSESRVSGVLVQAIDAETDIVAMSTMTNALGEYKLDYLQKKPYYLKFTPPIGYVATWAHVDNNDANSDVDHTHGLNTTRTYFLTSGLIDNRVDFGVQQGPLPVTWGDIQVKRVDKSHRIDWEVLSESQVKYYRLQRSIDNQAWTYVGDAIDPHGLTPTSYTQIDDQLVKSGAYTYRVEQMDFDGRVTYSPLVSILFHHASVVLIYPNPTSGEASLQLSVDKLSRVSVTLYDHQYNLIQHLETNHYVDQNFLSVIDLSQWANGLYYMAVDIDNVREMHPIIKVK
jgi:uncharacterized repeat protein (TIGR01451 family)